MLVAQFSTNSTSVILYLILKLSKFEILHVRKISTTLPLGHSKHPTLELRLAENVNTPFYFSTKTDNSKGDDVEPKLLSLWLIRWLTEFSSISKFLLVSQLFLDSEQERILSTSVGQTMLFHLSSSISRQIDRPYRLSPP